MIASTSASVAEPIFSASRMRRAGVHSAWRPRKRVIVSAFVRYIGIDYSGAETPTASLKGLRVYLAEGAASPVEVPPPPGPRKYWTRRGIAEWLVERLAEDTPTLVGVNRPFNCGSLSSMPGDAFAGVMVLSEVAERLMMMSGSGASTCAAECGRTAASRLNEVVTTTVPAGHRRLDGSSRKLSNCDQAAFGCPHSNDVPSTQMQ